MKKLKHHVSSVTQEKDKLWTENSQFQFDVADLKTQLKEKEEQLGCVSFIYRKCHQLTIFFM